MALMLLVIGGLKTKILLMRENYTKPILGTLKSICYYICIYVTWKVGSMGKGRDLKGWVLKTSTKSSIPEE